MPVDAWEGVLKINFNDTALPETEFVYEAGFTEKYYFPISASADTVRSNFRNLIAARCSLLAKNFYVFSSMFGKLGTFRDSNSVPAHATLPLADTSDTIEGTPDFCNDVQAALLLRFESNLAGVGGAPNFQRRWTRMVRGLKDFWQVDEATRHLVGTGYGNGAFDTVMPAPQVAPAVGTDAVFAITVAGGAVTAATVISGGTGYVAGGSTALVAVPFNAPDGIGSGASFDITIVAGVVTAIAINTPGAGYTNVAASQTVFFLPFRSEPYGLAQFQAVTDYFINFLSCLQNYCINFHPIRVANPLFPSGFMTQVDNTGAYTAAPYFSNRAMLQRFANRQTGRINTTRKARRKRRV